MFDYDLLPEHIRGGMKLYLEDHVEPGGFLRAVLENDLVGAFGKADNINRAWMFDIVTFIYNEVPASCWGSREAVEKWLEGGEK